jgi:ATP synthase (E/31 kDa) subunit
MEANVIIRGRQVDLSLIQSVLPNAVAEYKSKSNKDVVVTLDTENCLPADATGGVELFAMSGRIKVILT